METQVSIFTIIKININIMKHLKEYQLKINTDQDLEKWKDQWDGISDPPDSVINYVKTNIFPKMIKQSEELLYLPKKYENK